MKKRTLRHRALAVGLPVAIPALALTVRTLDTIGAGLNVTTVHQDRKPASPKQCTGDAAAVTPIQTTISG